MISQGGAPLFREDQTPRVAWILAFVTVACIAMYIVWGLIEFKDGWVEATNKLVYLVVMPLTVLPLVYLTRAFSRYSIIFTEESGLDLGFVGWRVRLPTKDIVSAQKVDIKWVTWGGIGWRLSRGRHHSGYILKNGTGIKVLTASHAYTFTSDDPIPLLEELRKANVKV